MKQSLKKLLILLLSGDGSYGYSAGPKKNDKNGSLRVYSNDKSPEIVATVSADDFNIAHKLLEIAEKVSPEKLGEWWRYTCLMDPNHTSSRHNAKHLPDTPSEFTSLDLIYMMDLITIGPSRIARETGLRESDIKNWYKETVEIPEDKATLLYFYFYSKINGFKL